MIAALVTLFLSNGITCGGAPVANSTATTPRFNVSVCLTSDVPVCGITYRFQRINAAGKMRVNSRDQVPGWDLNDAAQPFPFVIGSASLPPTQRDLGFTMIDPRVPVPPSVKRRLATYNISVLSSQPATSYSFRLDDASIVAIDPDGRCGALPDGFEKYKSYPVVLPIEQRLGASFTLQKK